MLIGELSKKTGFSRDTIRFYEKVGLIKVDKKQRRENNYKEYPEEAVERLQIIKRAKNLGFTLKEIKELIHFWMNKSLSKQQRIALFKTRIKMIDEKILKLKEVRSLIQNRIKQIERGE